jgi:hypothetical protein
MGRGALAGVVRAGHSGAARLPGERNLRHQEQNDRQWQPTAARTQESDHRKSDSNASMAAAILMDAEVARIVRVFGTEYATASERSVRHHLMLVTT